MKSLRNLLIFSSIITFVSCSDYLDRFPLDNPSVETFLRSVAGLDMAVNDAYNSVRYHGSSDVTGSFCPMLDAATDIGRDRNIRHLHVLGMGAANGDNGWA